MDCETKSAIVSWLPGLGAASYVAYLTASSGRMTTCTTNETHCLLASLPCGERYNVSVASVGDTCDSTERMSGYLTTGTVWSVKCYAGVVIGETDFHRLKTPQFAESCVPVNLSIHFNMSQARVTWGAARGAESYSVQAVSDQGLTATCNSTGTQCSVTGLQCSQIYNVTVAAKNDVCNNTARSETYRLVTG